MLIVRNVRGPVAIFLIVRFFGLHLTYVYVCTTVNHKRLGAHSYLVYSTHAPVPLYLSLLHLWFLTHDTRREQN